MTSITDPRSWAHIVRADYNPTEPIDRTQTVLFRSAGFTKNGVLSGSFYLSDIKTGFRISAEVFTAKGKLGYSSTTIKSVDSFYVSYSLPEFMTEGDAIKIPVTMNNLAPVAQQVRFYEILNNPYLKVTVPTSVVRVSAGKSGNLVITIQALRSTEKASVEILANSTVGKAVYSDSNQLSLRVLPKLGIERATT